MKQYTLKPNQSPFEVVDGPLAGRKYVRGPNYTEIPQNEAHRFQVVPEPAKAKAAVKPAATKEQADAHPQSNP